MVGYVPGDERAGASPADEIPLVQELLVGVQHRQARDPEVGRETSRGWDSLPGPQAAVQNGPAQSVIDLPEYRDADAAVERKMQRAQVAMPILSEMVMAKVPLSRILVESGHRQ